MKCLEGAPGLRLAEQLPSTDCERGFATLVKHLDTPLIQVSVLHGA